MPVIWAPFVITLVLLLGTLVSSRPTTYSGIVHVPIFRRSHISDGVENLPNVMGAIKRKYGSMATNIRRASSNNVPLTDELDDISYSAVVSIGTPAEGFNVMIDTGSSDLWVATSACTACTSDVPLFDTSKSSTYQNDTNTLEIDYESGSVTGYVSEDAVTFGGITLQNQQFLAVYMTNAGMLKDGLSGIMGLGFQSISMLQSPPFWQASSQPVFGIYLKRNVNNQETVDTAPGGTLTLGGTNTDLYVGNIEFINAPNGTTPGYWLQQVQTVTIQGTSIDIPFDDSLAAIDTGTTLIGAPVSIAQQIWANIPGSVALTDQYDGMYAFPCTTDVVVTLSFGGKNWPINAADMNFGVVDGAPSNASTPMCIGSIIDLLDSSTSWIIGDVFLKNVYSVFRADPPAVGFAQLGSGLENATTSGGSRSSGSVSSSIPLVSLSFVVLALAWSSNVMTA